MKHRKLAVSAIAMLATVGLVSACTPPDEGGNLPKVNWKFRGTQVQVIESQDCVVIINCKDEPYLLNVGFRVKIGQPNSAQTFVANNRNSAPQDVAPGSTISVSPAAGGELSFNDVTPVDLLDLGNTNNKLEIVGSYVWASEQDSIGNGLAADSTASMLKDALNATLATADISGLDANAILSLVMSNIGNALGVAIQNVPLFGLGDDILGGGIYVGIGARGALGGSIDALLGNTTIPTINLGLDVPPPITGGGIFTMTGAKTFNQTWTGRKGGLNPIDGKHQWWMTAGPA